MGYSIIGKNLRNLRVVSSHTVPKLDLKYFALILTPVLKKSMIYCGYSYFYTVAYCILYVIRTPQKILKLLEVLSVSIIQYCTGRELQQNLDFQIK